MFKARTWIIIDISNGIFFVQQLDVRGFVLLILVELLTITV